MAQLRRHADEFARLDARVLVVSFGSDEAARAWVRATCTPFPVLLDSNRGVYRAYGLDRSFRRTWTPRVLWYYLRRFASGRFARIQGDPLQLGGDFIIDRRGVVRYAHREWDPMDRPAPERLLTVLRDIRGA